MTFDEHNLLPNAGLIAPAALAQRLGIADLVKQHVHLSPDRPGAANSAAKALTVLGGMLAGADSIDDLDVLRAGAAPELFDDVRAPSTIGTWLRSFHWGNVRQLDAVPRESLKRAWQAGLGPDLSADLTIDVDSTIRQTYGLKKQGATFGCTKVRRPPPASLASSSPPTCVSCRFRPLVSTRSCAPTMLAPPARHRQPRCRLHVDGRRDTARGVW